MNLKETLNKTNLQTATIYSPTNTLFADKISFLIPDYSLIFLQNEANDETLKVGSWMQLNQWSLNYHKIFYTLVNNCKKPIIILIKEQISK